MSGAFVRTTSPGVGANGRIFITIKWDGRKLSISGVEGPMSNGNCRGSCGQIDMHPWDIKTYSEGWNADEVAKLREIWGRWHLNDTRAGCQHQRAAWDPAEVLEVTSYEVEKVERKAAGWVYPSEHPRGLLTKPCEVCGYKYGSAWLFEAVPLQVVEWLEGLPDTGTSDWGRSK